MTTAVAPAPHLSPPQAFWRALKQYDRSKIDLWMALRNAAGIVVPLAVGVYIGYPAGGLVAATGALNVAAADGVDAYRSRAIRMLASSVIGGAAVVIAALAARNDLAVLIVRTAWAFLAGLTVCLGVAVSDIAMISLVVIVIYTAQSMTPSHAVFSGLIAFAAGLLQTALSIAPWPIRGNRPERTVIGDFYRELARAATATPNPYGAPLASHQSTLAQDALSSLASDHSVAAERLFSLVSQAERIRLALFALSRNLARIRREDAAEPSAAAIDRFLEHASTVLLSIGRSLQGEPLGNIATPQIEILRENPAASEAQRTHLAEAQLQIDALAGQLRAALELATNTTPEGQQAFAARQVHMPSNLRLSGWLPILRANLSIDSSAFRHAVRLAICIALGTIAAQIYLLPRSYWLAMTVALVLKPDFGNTFSRGVLRLAGTYLGLMLATVMFHVVSPAVYIHVAWIGVLALIQRSFGRANYGIMVTALSALIVFLFSLNGVAPKDVIAARAVNTTIGGALALAIYLIWPTRERTHVPQALASMLDAYRLYFDAVSRFVLNSGVDPRELDRLRVDGRRARSNVETSVDRLAAEPYANAAQLRLINAMLASSHRFIHAAMALEAGLTLAQHPSTPQAFQKFSADLEKVLELLAAHLRGASIEPGNLPDLRADHKRLVSAEAGQGLEIETDRMTNSLNTFTDQLFRWDAQAKPTPSLPSP